MSAINYLTYSLAKQINDSTGGRIAKQIASGASAANAFAKEVITVSSSVVRLNKAIYQDADLAYVSFETADTRVFYDGSIPSATVGHVVTAGSTLILKSALEIANFQAIRAGTTDARITVTYSRIREKASDDMLVRKMISVATRNSPLNYLLSNGTDSNVTYRVKHYATSDFMSLSLGYGNWYLNNAETDGPNPITIKASIEINGTIYPARFSGADTITLNPGDTVFTDVVNVAVSKGASFYTRTNVVVTAGQKFPIAITTYPADAEGKTAGDVAYSGATTSTNERSYSPCALIGQPPTNQEPAVLLVGDSIASGQGDSPADVGFLVRAFGTSKGYLRVSKPSARTSDYLLPVRVKRTVLSNACSHAICQLGVNDVIGAIKLETIKANLVDIWNSLVLRGMKVYQTTITPATSTSTDGFATVANQTPHINNSVRLALNDWIRTTPAPLSGYFEVADTVESSRGSGLWKANFTADGTHPTPAASAAMAAAIDISKFVL